MKEFVLAALPWVLIGLALAVLAVTQIIKKQKDEKRGVRMAVGVGLDLILGVALNGCGLWESHWLGLVLGPLWGVAIASLISRKENEE